MTDLYCLVYVSKNLLRGTEGEIVAAVAQILEASQRNNAKVGVTGALMFNAGAFAQVLEGPRRAVEATFERIQRDARHTDVTVLRCGPAERCGFPDWSMAFVGQSAAGRALWQGIAAQSGFDPARMDGDQVLAMLHDLVLDEEGLPPGLPLELPPAPIVPAASGTDDDRPSLGLDVERVRAELPHPGQRLPKAPPEPARRPAKSPAPPAPGTADGETKSAIALAVFRAALAEERQRTTELRDALDEMQVALAASHERAERLTKERDLWATRAQVLASALAQEAGQVAGSSKPAVPSDAHPTASSTEGARAMVA